MEKYVCVDVDGVLLNLLGALKKYLKEVKNIELDINKVTNYNFKGCGIDRNIIYECFKEPEFFDSLEFFEGAVESLKKLQQIIKTKAYTASQNIEKIYTKRDKLCETLGLEGKSYSSGMKPTDLQAIALFDDCLAVHEQWLREGSQAYLFLIDATYNRQTNENKFSLDWSRIIRCKNFADAVDKFMELYETGGSYN